MSEPTFRPGIHDACPGRRRGLTLTLCTALHTLTHAYGSMLAPLYLLIAIDLKLPGVREASLIVTVYGLVYCLGSYGAGMIADRADRKVLLGLGLLVNAAAILGMGLTRSYPGLLALAGVAGVAGTFFHPCANALVPAHYPRSPGMAIGLLGMGSGLGFFLGPKYAGWRAQTATWQLPVLGPVAAWQRPCVELGATGLVVAALFLLLAREIGPSRTGAGGGVAARGADRLTGRQSRRVALIGLVLGCRDFAGVAGLSLAAIYLQRALKMSVEHSGAIVGEMMLLSVVVNPLLVFLTPGRRRLPVLAATLLVGGTIAALVPYAPARFAFLVLCGFQTCQLGSYALSDAGMLERVAPAVRGRVVGLFLVIAGVLGSSGPWVMGWWTDRLGVRAGDARAYAAPFGLLGLMMVLATLGAPLIARLREPGDPAPPPIDPLSEIVPRTLEPIG